MKAAPALRLSAPFEARVERVLRDYQAATDDAAVRDALLARMTQDEKLQLIHGYFPPLANRTPGAPVWMETIRAMGATPTPMGWSEVYTALQQKVIDGVEAQHPASYGSRLYEVTSHVTKTGHINLITGIVTSAAWFDKLPAEYRQILREESTKAGDNASRATEASLADYEKQMKEQGMTIAEIDVAPFREATKPVYDKLGYTELHQEIEKILQN